MALHRGSPAQKLDGAFTLIELLTTVGIIVLLAALLAPALTRGLEKAKQATCVGKMKQIGAVCFAYASDNQNELPGGANAGLGNPSDIWVYRLGPYLSGRNGDNAPQVLWSPNLKCPTNKQFDASGSSYGPVMGDFSFFGACAGGVNIDNTYKPSRVSDIPMPSKTPYWVEINNTQFLDGLNASGQSWQLPAIHSGGSNVLMADGHVLWVKVDEWNQSGGAPHPWAYHFALAYPKPSW